VGSTAFAERGAAASLSCIAASYGEPDVSPGQEASQAKVAVQALRCTGSFHFRPGRAVPLPRWGCITLAARAPARVTAEHWNHIEEAARERQVSPNQFVMELAIDALERREWPRTEAQIKVARASLFAAQVLARDRIANSRKK